MTFWEWNFLDNTIRLWGSALLVSAVAFTIFWLINRLLLSRFYSYAKKSDNQVDDLAAAVLQRTKFALILLLALYIGSLLLSFSTTVTSWLGTIALIIFLLQVAIWGNALIIAWLKQYQAANGATQAGEVTTVRALSFVVRLVFFSVITLLALDNIPGVEVTSLIASLGIGGIAVALAVQNILADLFASLSIALDKPFVLGDFIHVGEFLGTVENIGLKTTRVRSLTGEQLIFANNDLLSSRIRNYKRMDERRITFSVGVTYQTAAEALLRIPEIIAAAVAAQDEVRFDRAHFKSFGDSALIYEVVYYVLNPDYTVYMDIQQAINLAIFKEFEAAGIEFAYPTRTVFLANEPVPAANGHQQQPQKEVS